jgi:hypothetical protein
MFLAALGPAEAYGCFGHDKAVLQLGIAGFGQTNSIELWLFAVSLNDPMMLLITGVSGA